MLMLEQLARDVVKNWASGDLAQTVRNLDTLLQEMAADRLLYAAQIAEAGHQTNDDLEIDDDPLLSVADEGVWVSAWVWVPIESEDDDEEEYRG